MRPFGTPKQLEKRRLIIVQKIIAGELSIDEAAKRAQVTRRSVARWLSSYRASGGKGLEAKKHAGPTPHLTEKQFKKLEKMLLKGAVAYGFETDLWTSRRIAAVVKSEFKVEYHPQSIVRILRKLDWSFQKTALKAKERDEGKIQGWIRRSWPRVKKSSR